MALRIGTGAGFSGDRIDPAVELVRLGNLDYLIFECLAERTIAKAQLEYLNNPELGFDPLLEKRMLAVLPLCVANQTKIITNMGAANPSAAAECARKVAKRLGLHGLKIAAIIGDDVLDIVRNDKAICDDNGEPLARLEESLVAANAYLGASPIVEALEQHADVIITGRASDPAMFLAPQIFEFGWQMDDWVRLGKGTVTGHLLECAAQITGGYFADPGVKEVPDIDKLGFPLAEIEATGDAIISKTPMSGGFVTEATCKEQLLYEIHDPSRYYQPDVVADFSQVSITEVGKNRVAISGGSGRAKTEQLKVSVGYIDSWVGEGQISYAGINAQARAELAIHILDKRFASLGVCFDEVRSELIGVNSVFAGYGASARQNSSEVRVRYVGRSQSLEHAEMVGHEVESLYLNGPAGGGGVSKQTRQVLAVVSTLIPEHRVTVTIDIMES